MFSITKLPQRSVHILQLLFNGIWVYLFYYRYQNLSNVFGIRLGVVVERTMFYCVQ